MSTGDQQRTGVPYETLMWRITAAAAVCFALIFGAITELVVLNVAAVVRVDDDVASALHRLARAHPAWTSVMRTVTQVGAPVTWWVVLLAVAASQASRGRRSTALWLILCAAGASLSNSLVKIVLARDRPSFSPPVATASGYSFPSGHAEAATVAVTVLAALVFPRAAGRFRWLLVVGATVIAGAIGFSRLALGVHYLSDVLAGVALGLGWVCVGTLIMWRWQARNCARR